MPVFFLSLPELRSGASRLSGPRGSRWSACVWMSLHAFVSLPPCRLFIISASSFCLRLGSPALSDAFSLPLPLFSRIFAFVFPCIFFPPRFPVPSYSSSPCIFFALFPAASLSSLRLPSFCRSAPPQKKIFPSPLFLAFSLSPLHLPLCPLLFAFPRPQGAVSLLRLGAFPLTGILFALFLVRGFIEVRAHLLRQAGEGLPAFAGY